MSPSTLWLQHVARACAMSWLCAAAVVHGGQAGNNDDNCPMRAPPIERKQLQQQPGVAAVSLSKDRLRAAVLLNDGHAIQIYHTGCQHVGFDATRWIDELPKTPALQLQAIRQLITTALQDPHLKTVSMHQDNFQIQLDGTRVIYSHTQEALSAEFAHQSNGRYLLSVTYNLPY